MFSVEKSLQSITSETERYKKPVQMASTRWDELEWCHRHRPTPDAFSTYKTKIAARSTHHHDNVLLEHDSFSAFESECDSVGSTTETDHLDLNCRSEFHWSECYEVSIGAWKVFRTPRVLRHLITPRPFKVMSYLCLGKQESNRVRALTAREWRIWATSGTL